MREKEQSTCRERERERHSLREKDRLIEEGEIDMYSLKMHNINR